MAFKNVSVLGQSMAMVNIRAPKIVAFQMGPKTQNGYFFENDSNDFD
jgi:hypothetical protein